MAGRVADLAVVTGVAVLLTAVLAAPVLRAPSDRIFGMPLVGRHHDPFTAMAQFARPVEVGVYWQPVTDLVGGLLSRLAGPVAAYNWLVLTSVPLSAAATFLLARHLALSPWAAAVAALAYAFAPFHLAHAAYHPHVAQTQWLPLYLLALWRCLDAASPVAMALLVAASVAVTLSNFYTGLIVAVITPVAIVAWWLPAHRAGSASRQMLMRTLGALAFVVAVTAAYASYASGSGLPLDAYTAASAELPTFSARWWSYLVPPVAHPLLGAFSQRLFTAAGVGDGLLEQQLSIGWGIVLLAGCGVLGAAVHAVTARERRSITVLVLVGAVAFVGSLPPAWAVASPLFSGLSTLLYPVVPMFRAYARFGVAVQLMAVLLAGVGIDRLLASGRRARTVCALLVTLVVAEYAVSPSMLWRDVLPTAAHVWVRQQAGDVRALDCTPVDSETDSIRWLSGGRIDLLGSGAIDDCGEPHLAGTLAAHGYTHLLVAGAAGASPWRDRGALDGLRTVARFADGEVLAVTRPAPGISTSAMSGFYQREYDAYRSWRWMGADAAWTVVNRHAYTTAAVLVVELTAFHHARLVNVLLDGHQLTTVLVLPERRPHTLGPFVISPGRHDVVFSPVDGATVVSDLIRAGDSRPLSIAIGHWSWLTPGDQP